MLGELAAAFTLLTRLPVGRLGLRAAPASFAGAVWAYPVIGLVVGAAGGLTLLVLAILGLPPGFGAVCCIAATVLITGGLHEDGLADTADSLGGQTREQRLLIMRDSRIGSFGALALMLTVAARGSALAAMASPAHAASAMATAGALGRSAMLLPLLVLPPARPDGLAATLAGTGRGRLAAGLGIGVLASLLLTGAVWPAGLAALAGLAMAWVCSRHVGGYTGDLLGATSVLAECVVLGALAGG